MSASVKVWFFATVQYFPEGTTLADIRDAFDARGALYPADDKGQRCSDTPSFNLTNQQVSKGEYILWALTHTRGIVCFLYPLASTCLLYRWWGCDICPNKIPPQAFTWSGHKYLQQVSSTLWAQEDYCPTDRQNNIWGSWSIKKVTPWNVVCFVVLSSLKPIWIMTQEYGCVLVHSCKTGIIQAEEGNLVLYWQHFWCPFSISIIHCVCWLSATCDESYSRWRCMFHGNITHTHKLLWLQAKSEMECSDLIPDGFPFAVKYLDVLEFEDQKQVGLLMPMYPSCTVAKLAEAICGKPVFVNQVTMCCDSYLIYLCFVGCCCGWPISVISFAAIAWTANLSWWCKEPKHFTEWRWYWQTHWFWFKQKIWWKIFTSYRWIQSQLAVARVFWGFCKVSSSLLPFVPRDFAQAWYSMSCCHLVPFGYKNSSTTWKSSASSENARHCRKVQHWNGPGHFNWRHRTYWARRWQNWWGKMAAKLHQ